jgi:hypothetical protein
MTTDKMVLAALRKVAKSDRMLEIGGKTTHLVEADDETCVYSLVGDQLREAGVDFDLTPFEAAVYHLKGLVDAIRRLTAAGLLYPSDTVEHSFWVVME